MLLCESLTTEHSSSPPAIRWPGQPCLSAPRLLELGFSLESNIPPGMSLWDVLGDSTVPRALMEEYPLMAGVFKPEV